MNNVILAGTSFIGLHLRSVTTAQTVRDAQWNNPGANMSWGQFGFSVFICGCIPPDRFSLLLYARCSLFNRCHRLSLCVVFISSYSTSIILLLYCWHLFECWFQNNFSEGCRFNWSQGFSFADFSKVKVLVSGIGVCIIRVSDCSDDRYNNIFDMPRAFLLCFEYRQGIWRSLGHQYFDREKNCLRTSCCGNVSDGYFLSRRQFKLLWQLHQFFNWNALWRDGPMWRSKILLNLRTKDYRTNLATVFTSQWICLFIYLPLCKHFV